MDKNEELQLDLPGDKNTKSTAVYLKIVFLPVLMFIIALLGYFDKIDLKIGLHTVIMMGFILCVALIFARHSAEYASSVFEAANDDFKHSLKRFILDHFLTIGKDTKCNASFDEFASYYVKSMRNEQFASIASSIFPMLGILGTFISIAISMPNFNSTDTIGLENEISKLLNGVGTAFYISIYGIFLALWWMFFEKYGISRFQRLINRQKTATAAFFWTKEEIDRKYLQESLKHFDKIGTIFEHVGNEEFFTKLNKTIARKFEIFEELLNTEERAVKISSEHIKLTMGELSRTQREHKDLAKMHSEIVNAMMNLSHGVRDINLRMSEQYNRLLDIAAEKNTQLNKNIGTLDQSVVAFKLGIKEFETLMIQNQKELFRGFKNSIIEGAQAFKETYEDERQIDEKLRMAELFKKESKQTMAESEQFMKKLSGELEEESLEESLEGSLEESQESQDSQDFEEKAKILPQNQADISQDFENPDEIHEENTADSFEQKTKIYADLNQNEQNKAHINASFEEKTTKDYENQVDESYVEKADEEARTDFYPKKDNLFKEKKDENSFLDDGVLNLSKNEQDIKQENLKDEVKERENTLFKDQGSSLKDQDDIKNIFFSNKKEKKKKKKKREKAEAKVDILYEEPSKNEDKFFRPNKENTLFDDLRIDDFDRK